MTTSGMVTTLIREPMSPAAPRVARATVTRNRPAAFLGAPPPRSMADQGCPHRRLRRFLQSVAYSMHVQPLRADRRPGSQPARTILARCRPVEGRRTSYTLAGLRHRLALGSSRGDREQRASGDGEPRPSEQQRWDWCAVGWL